MTNTWSKSIGFTMVVGFPCALTIGCARGTPPVTAPVPAPVVASAPPATVTPPPPVVVAPADIGAAKPANLSDEEKIWDGLLKYYAGPTYFSEGNQIIAEMGGERPSPVVLMTKRTATLSPYRTEWYNGFSTRGIGVTTCDSTTARACGGIKVTTFLTLLGQTVTGDTARANTSEDAFNPAGCGGDFRAAFRGGRQMVFTLVKSDSGWNVIKRQLTMGSSGGCKE